MVTVLKYELLFIYLEIFSLHTLFDHMKYKQVNSILDLFRLHQSYFNCELMLYKLLMLSACLWCCLFFFHSQFVFLHVSHIVWSEAFFLSAGPPVPTATGTSERHRACFSVVSLLPSVGFFFFVCLNVLAVLPVLISSTLVLSVWLPGSAHLHLVWVISWVHIETRVAPPVVSLEISQLLVVVLLKIQIFWEVNLQILCTLVVLAAERSRFTVCVCVLWWCSMSQLSHVDRVCGSIFTTSAICSLYARLPPKRLE